MRREGGGRGEGVGGGRCKEEGGGLWKGEGGILFVMDKKGGRVWTAHSEHRFPGTFLHPTLRAPLSGTFLQTLPDLITPLKGHSLSPCSCPTDAVSALRKVRVL